MDRVSSEYSQNQNEAARSATFEETYRRYEFAEMVRIGLVLAEWLAAGAGWLGKMSRRVQGAHLASSASPRPETCRPPSEMTGGARFVLAAGFSATA